MVDAIKTPGQPRWSQAKRISYIGKPLVFSICLIPLLLVVLAAFNIYGSLGANPIEYMLDHFGNWGLRFLLITLAVTPLRHVIGKPWPLRFRRMLGLFAFFYVALHFIIYVWLDQSFVLSAIVEDVIKRPFITLGMLAVVMLLILAVTSPHVMRRKLAKRWQQLHYMIYPASILAVWHFWWQVKKDITEPLIYATLLALLLLFRVYQKRMKKRRNA